jgi:hypothetical protein
MEQTRQPLSIFSPADLGALIEGLLRSPTRLRPGTAALLAAAAVALGLLGDALFYDANAGINIPLWHLALVLTLLAGASRAGVTMTPRQLSLIGASLLLSALIAWRGSAALQFFDFMAAAFLVLLAIALPPRLAARRMGFLSFLFALAVGVYSMATGALRLLFLAAQAHSNRDPSDRAVQVGRAVVMLLPLLVVFGGLFIAADAVFESWARKLAAPNLENVVPHVFLFLFTGGTAAGVFWCALGYEAPAAPEAELSESRRLRSLEIGIVLGALALLFAAFVAVQLRYLFGGRDLVESTLDLTYSEYARRGFFELVVASALLLPVLLTMNWARRREANATLLFQVLALILVTLLAVVMASALERLRIYSDTFGLTELRFYAAAFLIWLAAVFVALVTAALRDRVGLFLWAATLLGAVALVVVNLLNPEALIARTNTSRLGEGRSFDAVYASSLGADAVPVLVDHLDRLAPDDRCIVAGALLTNWLDQGPETRGWNYSRMRAADAVQDNEARLREACAQPR